MKAKYPELSRIDARYFTKTVVDRSDGKCEVCGLPCVWIGEIHHIKAVKDGGDGFPENLIHLCPNCHRTVEKIKTMASDNPMFEKWIYATYGKHNAQRLINIAYGWAAWGNQA
jgi:hypothetical protein